MNDCLVKIENIWDVFILMIWISFSFYGALMLYHQNRKKILKFFTTNFKKENLYGDGRAISDTIVQYPFRGQRIQVQILWMY